MAEKIREEFKIIVYQTTVMKALKSFHYSIKRISSITINRNFGSTIEKDMNTPWNSCEWSAIGRKSIFWMKQGLKYGQEEAMAIHR